MTAIKLGQESDLTCVFALTGTSDFNSKMLYIIVMAFCYKVSQDNITTNLFRI